jgi:hypothetical protein
MPPAVSQNMGTIRICFDFNKKVVFKIPIIEKFACQEIIPARKLDYIEIATSGGRESVMHGLL